MITAMKIRPLPSRKRGVTASPNIRMAKILAKTASKEKITTAFTAEVNFWQYV